MLCRSVERGAGRRIEVRHRPRGVGGAGRRWGWFGLERAKRQGKRAVRHDVPTQAYLQVNSQKVWRYAALGGFQTEKSQGQITSKVATKSRNGNDDPVSLAQPSNRLSVPLLPEQPIQLTTESWREREQTGKLHVFWREGAARHRKSLSRKRGRAPSSAPPPWLRAHVVSMNPPRQIPVACLSSSGDEKRRATVLPTSPGTHATNRAEV